MTSKVNDKDSKANVGKIFNLFDDEKTGSISVKSLRRVAQDLGELISEEELNEMIDISSSTEYGLVSAEDFYMTIIRSMKWLFFLKLFEFCEKSYSKIIFPFNLLQMLFADLLWQPVHNPRINQRFLWS